MNKEDRMVRSRDATRRRQKPPRGDSKRGNDKGRKQ